MLLECMWFGGLWGEDDAEHAGPPYIEPPGRLVNLLQALGLTPKLWVQSIPGAPLMPFRVRPFRLVKPVLGGPFRLLYQSHDESRKRVPEKVV